MNGWVILIIVIITFYVGLLIGMSMGKSSKTNTAIPNIYRIGDRIKVVSATTSKKRYEGYEGVICAVDSNNDGVPYQTTIVDMGGHYLWLSESEIELIWRPGIGDKFL